jgi:hypothetical protein
VDEANSGKALRRHPSRVCRKMTLLKGVRKMRQRKGRRPCLTPSTPPNIMSMPLNTTSMRLNIIVKPPPMWPMAITRRAHAHHRHAEHHASEASKAHIELHNEHAAAAE